MLTFEGTDTYYYSKDADGVYLLYNKTNDELWVNVWEDVGSAEENNTKKSNKFYKDNKSVPNYENVTGNEAIRMDAGYTKDGLGIVRYTYPYNGVSLTEYTTHLRQNGWGFVGGSAMGGAANIFMYYNSTEEEIVTLIENKPMNLICVVFFFYE